MNFIKKHISKAPFILLILMLIMSAGMYIFNTSDVLLEYEKLGFPHWLLYFNLAAKILGVLALIIPQVPKKIKTFAWAGIIYIFLLALISHLMVGDGDFMGAVIGIVLWILATTMHSRKH